MRGRSARDLVVKRVLRGDKIPQARGEDPEVVRRRRAEERKAERVRAAAERAAQLAVERAAELRRAEATRRWKAEMRRQRQEDIKRLEWLEGVRRYRAASVADQGFDPFRWWRWLLP